jgi:class 3 adenylate cyclase
VLFCDLTGSTALGTDPEALLALLARYFQRMNGIVESHGGTASCYGVVDFSPKARETRGQAGQGGPCDAFPGACGKPAPRWL